MTGRCRVLYVVYDGHIGGSLASCVDFVRHTNRDQVELTFCVLAGPGASSDTLAAMGVEVVSFGASSWRDVGAAIRFWRFLRGRTFDVIHNNARTMFGHPVIALAGGRAVRVYQEHGDLHTEGDERAVRAFYRLFGRVYQQFLTVGDETRDAMVKEGIPASLIVDVGCPVDLEQMNPGLPRAEARAMLGVPADRVVVGTACRLVHQKDLPLFVDTAHLVAAREPRVHFVIAGEGHEEAELRARVASLGLTDRVSFVGSRSDMPVVWRAFDLFLMTSRQESFGRTILESLASGTPIVGVRPAFGGGRILDRAQGVRVIEGRSPIALADAVLALCADDELRESMGVAGRQWVSEQSAWRVDNWAQGLQQFYERVSRKAA